MGHFTSFDRAMASCYCWENFAQRLNSFTEPALLDSDAMWLSSGKPRKLSSFLKLPARK
jgi:hypothetical protein